MTNCQYVHNTTDDCSNLCKPDGLHLLFVRPEKLSRINFNTLAFSQHVLPQIVPMVLVFNHDARGLNCRTHQSLYPRHLHELKVVNLAQYRCWHAVVDPRVHSVQMCMSNAEKLTSHSALSQE